MTAPAGSVHSCDSIGSRLHLSHLARRRKGALQKKARRTTERGSFRFGGAACWGLYWRWAIALGRTLHAMRDVPHFVTAQIAPILLIIVVVVVISTRLLVGVALLLQKCESQCERLTSQRAQLGLFLVRSLPISTKTDAVSS